MPTPIEPIFLFADPDAGKSFAPTRFDAAIGERANHRFLEVAQVSMHVAIASFQFQNRIADELAGSVISHLAAARDAIDRNFAVAFREQKAFVAAATKCEHMRMLQ